jgi:hypothetical protein
MGPKSNEKIPPSPNLCWKITPNSCWNFLSKLKKAFKSWLPLNKRRGMQTNGSVYSRTQKQYLFRAQNCDRFVWISQTAPKMKPPSFISTEVVSNDPPRQCKHFNYVPSAPATYQEEKKPSANKEPDSIADRWINSLRKRDPEIQPTLPAIIPSRSR